MVMTNHTPRNLTLDQALAEAEARFVARNPRSMERHKAARQWMPGGNTRSVLHFDPAPLTMTLADGCMLEDLDGHRYVDFLGEYSAGLYGHTNQTIREAVVTAMERGTVLGAPNRYEAGLAQELVQRFPGIDLIRFCNSGSEANLMTFAVARAVTGREKFLAFRGGYHGGFLLMDGEHGKLNAPYDVELLDYNDTEGAVAAIRRVGKDLAAVTLEPMMGSGGCIPADQEFLEAIRKETEAVGALLIFDEVITSRLSEGGLQKATGVIPDLTALGKYLGGGLTFGAFGGRRDIMAHFDPSRPGGYLHAGTFNNNVLTMAAGLTGLTQVYTCKVAKTLNAAGDDLRRRINVCFKRVGMKAQATGLGSLMCVHFTDAPVKRPQDVKTLDPQIKRLFYMEMLERGQYMATRCMMTLSLPMGHPEYDGLVRAIEDFCVDNGPLLRELGYIQN
ncbi:aminotransferase class III-fold pyridoxal phosphate-dependent enzyme [Hwanghaeella grinnelliae]|uniref:Aminotransferase class III-fold pyridoxal phosphate-dependent enzyme n=2 Tax=Hwanghaeella grinnelliae TaxID=2500179 RepID=A0A3S2Y4G1_9PROT|nr:aminotransferase class III-fold pyridoxal phosphate-dependent enzyme [Hwanghaeella grinnelliae]